jgi:AraC-like DNA-binding protein
LPKFANQQKRWNLLRQRINAEAFHYYPPLERVYKHVITNCSEPIPLSEAASIAHLEKKYFSRLFRKNVGITFTQWKQFVRVQKAIDLMQSQHSSISDIAFSVGFGDVRSFERVFKKFTGVTPRAFRKSVAQGYGLSS